MFSGNDVKYWSINKTPAALELIKDLKKSINVSSSSLAIYNLVNRDHPLL